MNHWHRRNLALLFLLCFSSVAFADEPAIHASSPGNANIGKKVGTVTDLRALLQRYCASHQDPKGKWIDDKFQFQKEAAEYDWSAVDVPTEFGTFFADKSPISVLEIPDLTDLVSIPDLLSYLETKLPNRKAPRPFSALEAMTQHTIARLAKDAKEDKSKKPLIERAQRFLRPKYINYSVGYLEDVTDDRGSMMQFAATLGDRQVLASASEAISQYERAWVTSTKELGLEQVIFSLKSFQDPLGSVTNEEQQEIKEKLVRIFKNKNTPDFIKKKILEN